MGNAQKVRPSHISDIVTRLQVERWIEFLIDCLDRYDPDPDLEEGGDLEPLLAASGGPNWSTTGTFDEREQDHDFERNGPELHAQYELGKGPEGLTEHLKKYAPYNLQKET